MSAFSPLISAREISARSASPITAITQSARSTGLPASRPPRSP